MVASNLTRMIAKWIIAKASEPDPDMEVVEAARDLQIRAEALKLRLAILERKH